MSHPFENKSEEEIEAALQDPELMIKPPLNLYQRVSILVQKTGELVILHTEPFRELLAWVDFDIDTGRIVLVSRFGRLYDTGIPVPDSKKEMVAKAGKAYVIWMEEEAIGDIYNLPLTATSIEQHATYH